MKKQDLYDYVEEMSNKQISKINVELNKMNEDFKEGITKYLNESVFTGFDKFVEKYTKITNDIRDDIPLISQHYYSRDAFGALGEMSKIISNMAFGYKEVLIRCMNSELGEAPSGTPKEILDLYNEIKPKYLENVKTKQDIRQLKKELDSIIKSSKTAKESYKYLVELKVDMSNFKEKEITSLATIKLSKDVSLLNKAIEK